MSLVRATGVAVDERPISMEEVVKSLSAGRLQECNNSRKNGGRFGRVQWAAMDIDSELSFTRRAGRAVARQSP
jgi:hypothetical protein